jgi:hypothetical protein
MARVITPTIAIKEATAAASFAHAAAAYIEAGNLDRALEMTTEMRTAADDLAQSIHVLRSDKPRQRTVRELADPAFSPGRLALPTIQQFDISGSHRTGRLAHYMSADEITATLGFGPSKDDDPHKVTKYWGFKADGIECAIWDYKGVRWSTYGPKEIFDRLFPGNVRE